MRNNRSWFGLVSLALMLGIFFLIANQVSTDGHDGETNQIRPSDQSANRITTPQPNEELLYLVKKEVNVYQVVSYNITTDQKIDLPAFKVPKPIVNVIGQSADGVIWVMLAGADEFSGSLARIDFQGNMKVVIDRLVSIGLPAISADGGSLIYVTFSNAEADFGFKLIERSLTNDEVKILTSNTSGISLPRYCFQTQICYISQTDQTSKIISQSPGGKAEQVIYQTESNLVDWSVVPDRIVVVDRPNTTTNRLTLIVNDRPSIIESTSEVIRQVYISESSPKVATYRLKKTTDQEGSIIFTDLDTRQSKIVSDQASFLVGWRTRQ